MISLRDLAAGAWRDSVAAALEDGWRFAGLYAAGDALRAVFTRADDELVLRTASGERRAASIVDLVAAAGWDEREAHDLHGWAFDGHEPLRALADHGAPTELWTVPVQGEDPHQVAVGPIHAGVIESGHFRFATVGERILHLDLRLFYKHRGLEAAAEGRRCEDALAYAQRACAADAVTNSVAYAQACEAALGLWPDDALRRARTVLLELERLYNHLNDIAAICAGVGFAPGNMLFASLKERAQRLNQHLTGHRFLFGSVAVGHGAAHVPAAEARAAREELGALREDFERGWRELAFAGSLQERLDGIGAISPREAERLGAAGPAARAAGVAFDRRSWSPRLSYEGFEPAVPERPAGDVAARFEMRGVELRATFAMLDALLSGPVDPGGCERRGEPSPLGVSLVESRAGETLCAVELDERRVARLHLRTGSYANWPVLAVAVREELLPEFPLINKSFELCYACVDR